MTDNTFHRVSSVADRFEVTSRTVLHWVRTGQLEAIRLSSGQVRIPEEAIQKSLRPVPAEGKKAK